MIPLRDNIPHYRKPIVTVSIIIVNVLIFIYESSLGEKLEQFIYLYGFIPNSLLLSGDLFTKIKPLFTSMFLHASWLHLTGNMLFMWIFADNVEDKLGHSRFLAFYLACGLFASLIHSLLNLSSPIPTIGASGAIAGVLGAYFAMFPYAKVLTLIPFFIFWEIVELPAFFFLGVWFIYQFFLGVFSIGGLAGGIAFWAHIGGFIGGMLLLRIFRKR
jgi:membrane associated rhomboid family serine protease